VRAGHMRAMGAAKGNEAQSRTVNPTVAKCTAAGPPLLRPWQTRLGASRRRAKRWGFGRQQFKLGKALKPYTRFRQP
jgi:hypothetical protein